MRAIIILVTLGTLVACQPSGNSGYDGLFGEYEISGFNSRVTIELKPDGEFIYERRLSDCFGGAEIRTISGSYLVESDRLKLDPKQLTDVSYVGHDKQNFKKDSLKYYLSDSTFLITEFQVFRWDSVVYLLTEDNHSHWGFLEDENDYEQFSDYYNSGSEPKSNGPYFVKRVNDHLPKTELNVDGILLKYRNRFLREPIVGEILTVDKIEQPADSGQIQLKNRYTINRGKRDGVMENMKFYGPDGCCTIKIIEVDDRISFGRIEFCYDCQADCGKGERVTTYLER